jgi:hypothetical protein
MTALPPADLLLAADQGIARHHPVPQEQSEEVHVSFPEDARRPHASRARAEDRRQGRLPAGSLTEYRCDGSTHGKYYQDCSTSGNCTA